MPEITELLERAAPGGEGPAPFDDIVRRGRRRRAMVRTAAVGAPLAAVAIVVAVVVTGGGPTGVVIDPPPMAETPDPTPTPPAGPTEPAPDELDEIPPVDTSGWVTPTGLAADLLVVEADGGEPRVVRLGADGSTDALPLADGVPNAAGLVPDRLGGFAWQPDWQSAAPAPVLHQDAEGAVTILDEGDDGPTTLVGRDLGLDRPLAVRGEGSTPEDTTADLLALSAGGSGPGTTMVRAGVGAWETGIFSAAAMENAVYVQFVEAMQNVVLDPPDSDPLVVFEGGELNGEYPRSVGFVESTGQALALVERGTAFGDEPHARLLVIDPVAGEIVEEIDVPLGLGLAEGATVDLLPRVPDISVQGDHVLVNRRTDEAWLPPIVHDLGDGEWSLLEHRDGGRVTGRAFLAPPSRDEATAEQAACKTQDQDLRNAEPRADELSLYLPCKDEAEPVVYRVPSGIEPGRDVTADLTAALELLVEPLLEDEDLAARGYYMPADRGQPVLRSVTVDGGHAVVDFGFPNGVGNLSTSFAGAVWHQSLLGTVLQFPQVEAVEFRFDGSCDDYATAFEGDGCRVFGRVMAPWNSGAGA